MSESAVARRRQISDTLNRLLAIFTATFDPHLDSVMLTGMGIDTAMFNLEQQTECGSCFFSPISQKWIDSLHERPDIELDFRHEQRHPACVCIMEDALHLQGEIRAQLLSGKTEDTCFSALEATKWDLAL